jgi:hypothetical protein
MMKYLVAAALAFFSLHPALAVEANDPGQEKGKKKIVSCLRLTDISVRKDGYVKLLFKFVTSQYWTVCNTSKTKQEMYFAETVPAGKIRGVKGISGVTAKGAIEIIVEPDTLEIHFETSGQKNRLAEPIFVLKPYISQAKKIYKSRNQSTSWQKAWKRSEGQLSAQAAADKTPPKIVLRTPNVTQSKKLFRLDSYQTYIRGKATDKSGVATVNVRGETARVKEDGSFAKKIKLALGANQISVKAEDIHGNVSERKFTIIREEYIPADTLADVDMPPKTRAITESGV